MTTHALTGLYRDGIRVRVVCSCGWTRTRLTYRTARRLWAKHADRYTADYRRRYGS